MKQILKENFLTFQSQILFLASFDRKVYFSPPFSFWILKENFLFLKNSIFSFIWWKNIYFLLFLFSFWILKENFLKNSIFSFIWWKNIFFLLPLSYHFMKQILKENFLSEILFLASSDEIYIFSPSPFSLLNFEKNFLSLTSQKPYFYLMEDHYICFLLPPFSFWILKKKIFSF